MLTCCQWIALDPGNTDLCLFKVISWSRRSLHATAWMLVTILNPVYLQLAVKLFHASISTIKGCLGIADSIWLQCTQWHHIYSNFPPKWIGSLKRGMGLSIDTNKRQMRKMKDPFIESPSVFPCVIRYWLKQIILIGLPGSAVHVTKKKKKKKQA